MVKKNKVLVDGGWGGDVLSRHNGRGRLVIGGLVEIGK
jgi:hypothetical protein